ncbi:18604_t:CDS:1, partial [Gigaspora margarita]
ASLNYLISLVIGNPDNAFTPGFICTLGTYSSNVEGSSSATISNLYTRIFQKRQTRFSGPLVIG